MKTKVTFTKEIEIELPQPLYVCVCDSIYYKFSQKEEVEVLTFQEDMLSTIKFSCSLRKGIYEHEIEIAQLEHIFGRQITEDEFYSKLNELLNKYVINKEIVGVLFLTPEQQIEAEKELDNSLID